MAEFLFWCLVVAGGALAICVLGAAMLKCLIADNCDQHAKHIDWIDRQGGEGWE